MFGLGLTQSNASLWGLAPGFFLDAIQLCNPYDGFLGNGRTAGLLNINKLTPDMGHAGHLTRFVGPEHTVEAGIAIRMYPALVA